MDDKYDELTWRERGVANWARDCGFELTEHDGLYELSSSQNERLVVHFELAEIERYLETHC